MIPWRLVLGNLRRRPLRTGLTALTVAAAMLVFASLLALDRGLRRMLDNTADDAVVIAFQRYKACPPFSRLPAHYADRIAALEGVVDVMPVRFLLSSCQTTTDLVALHGVAPDKLRAFRALRVDDAAYAAFAGEQGAALVGRAVARRYGWRVGQTVTLGELRGISFVVRGIFDAPGSSTDSVILVHRAALERAIDEVGVATLFMVRVDGPAQVDAVSRRIDDAFAGYPARTQSGPERAFIASNVEDFRNLVALAQVVAWLGLGLLLGAVANAISMNVRERLGELALLRTRGFTAAGVVRVVLAEAAIVSAAASVLGLVLAWLLLRGGRFAVSIEGFTIAPHLPAGLGLLALATGTALGVLAALLPALHGARTPIVVGLGEVR